MSVFYRDGRAGTLELESMFGDHLMDFPKNTDVLEKFIRLFGNKCDLVLDYFAGSGTTAHALLNLNKEDKNHRKYILIEFGDYFDSLTKPRIQKAIYSSAWADGKPLDTDGQSHIFKYMALEGSVSDLL